VRHLWPLWRRWSSADLSPIICAGCTGKGPAAIDPDPQTRPTQHLAAHYRLRCGTRATYKPKDNSQKSPRWAYQEIGRALDSGRSRLRRTPSSPRPSSNPSVSLRPCWCESETPRSRSQQTAGQSFRRPSERLDQPALEAGCRRTLLPAFVATFKPVNGQHANTPRGTYSTASPVYSWFAPIRTSAETLNLRTPRVNHWSPPTFFAAADRRTPEKSNRPGTHHEAAHMPTRHPQTASSGRPRRLKHMWPKTSRFSRGVLAGVQCTAGRQAHPEQAYRSAWGLLKFSAAEYPPNASTACAIANREGALAASSRQIAAAQQRDRLPKTARPQRRLCPRTTTISAGPQPLPLNATYNGEHITMSTQP